MVAVASVLVMDTNVIIIDEPTIAHDYKGYKKMKEIVATLYGQKKVVLSILHDMDFVDACFERVIVMSQGCYRGWYTRGNFSGCVHVETSEIRITS